MVEISLSGSGEGLGLETGRGYSTTASAFYPRHPAASDERHSVAFASDAALDAAPVTLPYGPAARVMWPLAEQVEATIETWDELAVRDPYLDADFYVGAARVDKYDPVRGCRSIPSLRWESLWPGR